MKFLVIFFCVLFTIHVSYACDIATPTDISNLDNINSASDSSENYSPIQVVLQESNLQNLININEVFTPGHYETALLYTWNPLSLRYESSSYIIEKQQPSISLYIQNYSVNSVLISVSFSPGTLNGNPVPLKAEWNTNSVILEPGSVDSPTSYNFIGIFHLTGEMNVESNTLQLGTVYVSVTEP